MTLKLNGESRNIEAGANISDLLRLAGMADKPVAVEVNREIIPRSLHQQHQLQQDDRVEIVHAIGGG
ncbi:MAG: sulfur carrier protein ThiS [Gammaproteobacteria bacterium]|nr:sulfur carrier protein ThiS [Gammaproteobacteria bacterium]